MSINKDIEPHSASGSHHKHLPTRPLKIKICGMKYPQNIQEVSYLHPDFMGFIFYPKSPRFVEPLDIRALKKLNRSIKKIGVFVNEDINDILAITHKYELDGVQLHGKENVRHCLKLKEAGLIVIKVFHIAESSNFKVTRPYEPYCDYFLFDTQTDAYGGSGLKFDWSLLNEYKGKTPFLLSGGITIDDEEEILKINHPKLLGIDLNSKFEIEPGLKDVDKLQKFFDYLNKKNRVAHHHCRLPIFSLL